MDTTPSHGVSKRVLALGFFAGVLGGYASVAFGILGIALALVVVGVVIADIRRSRLLPGIVLLGLGVGGLLALGPVLATTNLCSSTSGGGSSANPPSLNCYSPLTFYAAIAYSAIGFVGLIGSVIVVVRHRY
jgi:energy-coupling factor transporter transmembrane protein EcfT